MIFANLFKDNSVGSLQQKRSTIARNLLRREAQMGGKLFGPIPKGHRREFFCLDPNTWIWHEEWLDGNGQRKERTTRYDVRRSTILKAQDNGTFHLVGLQEARHLMSAAELYQEQANKELYPTYEKSLPA